MDRNRRMLGLAAAAAAASMFVVAVPAASAAEGTVKVKCYGASRLRLPLLPPVQGGNNFATNGSPSARHLHR